MTNPVRYSGQGGEGRQLEGRMRGGPGQGASVEAPAPPVMAAVPGGRGGRPNRRKPCGPVGHAFDCKAAWPLTKEEVGE